MSTHSGATSGEVGKGLAGSPRVGEEAEQAGVPATGDGEVVL